MSERWRFYLAGVLHGVAVMLLVAWALGPRARFAAFIQRGVPPVALLAGLVLAGVVFEALVWLDGREPSEP
jgi:hypothetical protein